LKELEDYKWFPTYLRNFQTDFIGFMAVKLRLYRPLALHLNSIPLKGEQLTDLCSGSGKPAIDIFRHTGFTNLELTDKFPSSRSEERNISYSPQSVDIRHVEFDRSSCYTVFNSFHHFKDEEKLAMIRKIKNSGAPAFIAEILEPGFLCLLKVILTTSLGCVLFTPFVQPFSLGRMICTYLIPVNPITITYDGIISVFRSATLEHYMRLFSEVPDTQVFRLRSWYHSIIVIQVNAFK
jgi:hypothetical protein